MATEKAVSCGNPDCDADGKLKCAACSTVKYCSPACQKAHWPNHKTACKAARTSSNGVVAKTETSSPSSSAVPIGPVAANAVNLNNANYQENARKMQIAKLETQKAFTAGDFASAVKSGNEALTFARLLPEPAATIESIQIHLNMTTAYLQLKNSEEAHKHSKWSVELSEKGMCARPGDSHAVEMLAVSLGSRTNVLILENMVDEAEKQGSRALSLAEKMFGPSDPRLFKYLRAMGLIREKQNKTDESIKMLTRAYDVVFDHLGPLHPDTQTVCEELISVLFKRGGDSDKDKAILASKRCYDTGAKVVFGEKGEKLTAAEGALGDCAARYATVLAKLDKEKEAEPIMRHALALRERSLGPDHPAVGVCLGYMAGILEGQGNYGEEPEEFLKRAMAVFTKFEGADGQHVLSTVRHLQRIRIKREGGLAMQSPDDDDDGIVTKIKEENTKKSPTSAGQGQTSGGTVVKAASPTATANKTAGTKSKSSSSLIPEKDFGKDDGVGRMQHATLCFQVQEFARAEILLAEALEIFTRDNGPTHASTMAARQNLEVVRANALNKLWQEVAKEEIQALALAQADQPTVTSPSSSAPGSPDRPMSGKGQSGAAHGVNGAAANGTTSSTGNNKSSSTANGHVTTAGGTSTGVGKNTGTNKGVEEVTWCTPSRMSAEDAWLFRETPKSPECIIA